MLQGESGNSSHRLAPDDGSLQKKTIQIPYHCRILLHILDDLEARVKTPDLTADSDGGPDQQTCTTRSNAKRLRLSGLGP
jgi:hypothetical protein